MHNDAHWETFWLNLYSVFFFNKIVCLRPDVKLFHGGYRGWTALGAKQTLGVPMFEPKVFREQMYCIGESTWRHWRPPPSPRVTPLALPAVKIAMSTKRHNNNNVQIAFVSENVASFFAKIRLFKKKLSSKNPLFTLVSFGRKITQNTLAMDCVKGKMKLNRFFHFLRFTQSVCLVWYSFGQSSVLLVASFTFPS